MEDLDSFAPRRRSTRRRLPPDDIRRAERIGALANDAERVRPRYFDGRRLSATDLSADFDYFDRRQRDLASTVDGGVVEGLGIEWPPPGEGGGPLRLRVGSGHGLTRAGELVLVREAIVLDLADLPTSSQLDAVFDLDERPRPPARTQSGIFALTLRPVEFQANPVAPYPKNITGERVLEDGEVIEATLFTLVPLASESGLDAVREGRAGLARRIFVEGLDPARSIHGLPIAVVAIERGQISWVDVHLARRRAMADPTRGFGAGARPRLEASLQHYDDALKRIIAERLAVPLGLRFGASEYFEVLPPAGVLPAAAVEVQFDRVFQYFFPPGVDAEIALVPEDEIPGLIEEAIDLGPIDLAAGAASLESTPVLITIPVPREEFPEWVRQTGGVPRRPVAQRLARSLAHRRPVDAFLRRALRRSAAEGAPAVPLLEPWQNALANAETLLFVRQRQRAQTSFAQARYGPIPAEQRPSGTIAELVRNRLELAGELGRFDRLLVTAGPDALERLETLLSNDAFEHLLFVNGLVAELSYRARRKLLGAGESVGDGSTFLTVGSVPPGAPLPLRVRPLRPEDVDAVADRYANVAVPQGLVELATRQSALFDELDVRIVLAQTLRVPELDQQVANVREAERDDLAARLLDLARDRDVSEIRDFIGYLRPQPPRFEPPAGATGYANVEAVGAADLFRLLWDHSPDLFDATAATDVRGKLDAFVADLRNAEPLFTTVLLTSAVVGGWRLDVDTSSDAKLVLQSLYWRSFGTGPLFVATKSPRLGEGEELQLSGEGSQLGGIESELQRLAQLSALHDADPGLAGLGARFEEAGFPGPTMEPGDAYRMMGMVEDAWAWITELRDLEVGGHDLGALAQELIAELEVGSFARLEALLHDWRLR